MTQREDMIQPGDQPQTDKLHDHHRQQLSAMLDEELLPDQAKFMLRRLEHDGELAACWERWQVCGDILRGRHEALLPADFSRRVAGAIAGQDDAGSATQAPAATRHPRWARWGGGAALAASVAMAALFVGRQVPAPEPEPAVPTQLVASANVSPVAETAPKPAKPLPSAPLPGPDAATRLATAAAVAQVPRRAVERRARAQQQRAGVRLRRTAAAQPQVQVAAASAAPAAVNSAPPSANASDVQPSAPVTALFAAEPVQPRPWPRAILPGFPADGAFAASYGQTRQEHPFHPFEPRVELQPVPAPQPPATSGPR